MILVLAPNVRLELVRVPSGEFLMGSDSEGEDYADEKPSQRVFLPEFLIGKYPVTAEQYTAFLRASRYPIPPPREWRRQHPITQVSWFDAQAFCRWAGDQTKRIVRLPSEAEWEKAARGTDGRIWPWGNNTPDPTLANFKMHPIEPERHQAAERSSDRFRELGDTSAVGQFGPKVESPYGCADMSGNVWEWTLSLYRPYPYCSQDGREITRDVGMRVLRGGSFLCDHAHIRCTSRLRQPPRNSFLPDAGFRVCVELA